MLQLSPGLGRQAGYADPHRKHTARQRQLRQLLLAAAVAGRGQVQRAPVAAAKAGHGGAERGCVVLGQNVAAWRYLQHAAAFEHGAPVVAVHVYRCAIGPAAVAGLARLPAFGLGIEPDKHLALALRVAVHVARVALDGVRWRIGPVHGAAVGRPGQAVGVGHAAQHLAHHRGATAGVHTVQRAYGLARAAGRLVDGAHPQAALGVAAAIVAALVGRVDRQARNLVQLSAPIGGAADAVAQHHHPAVQHAAAAGRCHAAGLGRQVPAVEVARAGHGAPEFFARHIHAVEHTAAGLPERGFAQRKGLGDDGMPSHERNS